MEDEKEPIEADVEDVVEEETVVEEAEVEEEVELTPEQQLEADLAEARQEAAENKDGWQRTLAEFQNYKRRTANDLSNARKTAGDKLLNLYFEVLDDLHFATLNVPDFDEKEAKWAKGVLGVFDKAVRKLEAQGISLIDAAPGTEFDPLVHEALVQTPTEDFEEGQIMNVIRPGYRTEDRVIRPTQVQVAA